MKKIKNRKLKYTKEELKEKIKESEERKIFYEGLKEELKISGENEISLTDPDARMMDNNPQNFNMKFWGLFLYILYHFLYREFIIFFFHKLYQSINYTDIIVFAFIIFRFVQCIN